MNPGRPQSSALVDLKDPIQVHLLTETALSDSRRFEILSQEEVDDLKKQCQSLTQRIEQTRQNLALQSKYRDAAMSMAKLYSPGGKRKSILGGRHGARDSAGEAELESQACERRCEELASELWNLEKRIMEPQRRLLEHTAGILQLTHKSQRKPVPAPPGPMVNGMPGSPESMYTYSNGRSSMDAPPPDDVYFGGAQNQLEGMQPVIRAQKNSIEIPMKSPIREQATRLRDQELQFRAQADAMNLELDALRRENDQRGRMVSDLERKLEGLNKTLRDVIVSFNPSKNSDYRQPPYGRTNGSDRALEPGDMVASQLEYLSKGLYTIKQNQQSMPNQTDSVAEASAAVAMAQAEGRMGALNQQIKDLLLSVNARPPPPPNASDLSGLDTELDDQISYFQYALRVIETELVKATEAAADAPKRLPAARGSPESEAALKELWDSLQSAFGNLQRQKEDRRRYLKEKGLQEDDDEADMLDMFSPDDNFSVAGVVSRVRNLSGQLVKLSEQKAVLKRQVKQQRELNSKSDSEKDTEIQNKVAEIRAKEMEIQDKTSEIRAKDSELRSKTAEFQAKLLEMQTQAKEHQDKDSIITAKDAELLEMDSKVFSLESRVKDLEMELEEVRAKGAESNVSSADVEAKDSKIRDLEAQVAETKSYLEKAQSDASQTQGMLLSALRDLDTANKKSAADESEAVQTARAELMEKRDKLAALEASSSDLQSRLNMTETSRRELQERMDDIDGKIESLESQLAEARTAKTAAEQAAEYKQKELDGKQREIKEKDDVVESMNLMVIELKTELTIAQAELDGAYGSRAERAADLAAIKSSKEVVGLQTEIQNLKQELENTIKQLGDITAETIKAEKDKLEVEGKLDDAVAMRTSLETEVQELRDRLDKEILESREKIGKLNEELDSERLKVAPSGDGAARPGAGASMLSEQFRATMREERKKFQEDLRVRYFASVRVCFAF